MTSSDVFSATSRGMPTVGILYHHTHSVKANEWFSNWAFHFTLKFPESSTAGISKLVSTFKEKRKNFERAIKDV